MKSKYLFAVIFFFIFLKYNFANANSTIVYLDVNLLMKNANAIQKLNDQLNNINKKNQKIFKTKEQTILEQRDALIKKKNVIDQDTFKKESIIYEENIKKFNILKNKSLNELKIKKLNAEKIFANKLQDILNDYSKKNSIDLIIRKESLLNGSKDLEITNDIIKIFNTNVKKIELSK